MIIITQALREGEQAEQHGDQDLLFSFLPLDKKRKKKIRKKMQLLKQAIQDAQKSYWGHKAFSKEKATMHTGIIK